VVFSQHLHVGGKVLAPDPLQQCCADRSAALVESRVPAVHVTGHVAQALDVAVDVDEVVEEPPTALRLQDAVEIAVTVVDILLGALDLRLA